MVHLQAQTATGRLSPYEGFIFLYGVTQLVGGSNLKGDNMNGRVSKQLRKIANHLRYTKRGYRDLKYAWNEIDKEDRTFLMGEASLVEKVSYLSQLKNEKVGK